MNFIFFNKKNIHTLSLASLFLWPLISFDLHAKKNKDRSALTPHIEDATDNTLIDDYRLTKDKKARKARKVEKYKKIIKDVKSEKDIFISQFFKNQFSKKSTLKNLTLSNIDVDLYNQKTSVEDSSLLVSESSPSNNTYLGKFPSVGASFVLPGPHIHGLDLDGNVLDASQVLDWEIDHADIIFGSFGNPIDNSRVDTLGYMYLQKLEANAHHVEDDLRNIAEESGYDYENFFLHFSEDTILAEVKRSHGNKSVYNRKPMIVGYTADADHAGFLLWQDPPWNADAFENVPNGGALYVYHSEKIDRLFLAFSQYALEGSLSIEYPSEVDETGLVTNWKTVQTINDNTLGMTQDDWLTWEVPSDWVRAATHDGSGVSYGGGAYFGTTFLRDQGKLFALRIKWTQDASVSQRPHISDVLLNDWIPVVDAPSTAPEFTPRGEAIEQWRQIKGFDRSADLDNDNYLNTQEYAARSNLKATARYRWESRVVPVGKMWSQVSSWAVTNLSDPGYKLAASEYYPQIWGMEGLKGAYNDDTTKFVGENQFYTFSGGLVSELGEKVGTELADTIYKEHFVSMLKNIIESTPDSIIGANIAPANLFGRNGQTHLAEAANVYLREDYFFPSMGYSGYAGIAKFWDNNVLALQKQKVIFQGKPIYGRTMYFGNNETNWKKDQYAMLAIYYLNHQPGMSFLSLWNNTYFYGSGVTDMYDFYSDGVSNNIAYQPTHLMQINLGLPSNSIPEGKEAIKLMASTLLPNPADYTIVADSTSTQIIHQDFNGGSLGALPTFTYYMDRSNSEIVPDGPTQMVLARDFDHGMVLYRTDFFGRDSQFYDAPKITINLDSPMRPVDEHGNIGSYTNSVEIGGYQGLILLK